MEILSLFGFVLLHEFGHVFAARIFGINTDKVVLFPFGGVAFLEGDPEEPWKQIVVAISGPLVNLGIFCVLTVFVDLDDVDNSLWVGSPLAFIAYANLALAIFNLIPAFPMDGGRILRSAIRMLASQRTSDLLAMIVGQAFAVLLIVAALFIGDVMFFLVGMFVFFASPMETGYHPFWFFGYRNPVC